MSNVKRFADDASLFSVVCDVNASPKELNDEMKKINKWAFPWKMSFNPDPSNQVQEVIFSRKIKKLPHPSLVFNNNNVLQASSQKHLSVTLDVKVTFDEQFNNVLNKVNKTTRDAFPAAKIRKEWFRKIFNVWNKSHFSNFAVE